MFFSKQSLRPCVFPRRYRVRVSQRCSLVLIGRAHAPNASRSTSRKRGAGAILRKAIPLPDSRADNSPYFLSSPSMIERGKEEERNPRMARTGLRRGRERVMTATSASVPRSSLRVFQTSSLLTRRPTLNGLRRAILSTLVALSLQSPFCFDPSDVTYHLGRSSPFPLGRRNEEILGTGEVFSPTTRLRHEKENEHSCCGRAT